jgi:hypothetical protein
MSTQPVLFGCLGALCRFLADCQETSADELDLPLRTVMARMVLR